MERRSPAVVDDDHLVFVNHEAYFFSSVATKLRFEKMPWKWCGTVTDPVTLERFEPDRKSTNSVYNGRRYYFITDSTRVTFQSDPGTYRAARNRMVPPTGEPTTEDEAGDPTASGADIAGGAASAD